jgi:polyisoprenoid-binding protein YceI
MHFWIFPLMIFYLAWMPEPKQNVLDSMPLVSSQVTFKISNAEIVANGRFEKIETQIYFDPEHLDKTKFSSRIEIESIKTGIRLRDQHLKKPVYFNADLFPHIFVELKSVKNQGQNLLFGVFSISIKGITKEQGIPFRWKKENGQYHFDAGFDINRRDFKVGGKSWTLSDLAKVKVAFVVQDVKGGKL